MSSNPIVPVYPDNKQPYGRTTERQDLDTRSPVMTGSLYTRPTGALVKPTEVVNKEYVDQFRVAPLATVYLPYIVGNYYTDNFGVAGYSPRNYNTVRNACLALYYLGTESWHFDQAVIRVTTSAANTRLYPAVYRCSESTLLPTALLYSWGALPTTANGTIFVDIDVRLTGLVGLLLQRDGAAGNVTIEASSAAVKHGSCAIGQSIDGLVNAVSPPVPCSYVVGIADGTITNQVPDPSIFKYSNLDESQADGAGLFLRRAA